MEEDESDSNIIGLLRRNDQLRILLIRAVIVAVAGGATGGLGIIYFKHILGADALILGMLTSLSSVVILIAITFSGWVSDNFGRRKVFIVGSALTCIPPLLFFLANSWPILIPAFVISAVASSLIAPSYQYIIRVVTKSRSRSTSIAIINAATNAISIVVPPLCACIISFMGGLIVVKYAFFVQCVLIMLATLYVARKLRVPEAFSNPKPKLSIKEPFCDLIKVYKISRERKLHYWAAFVALGAMVNIVVNPFWSLYAYEVCGTPEFLIGFLSTAQSLTYILLLIPISKLSDKIGRKKIVLGLRPFLWLTFITLILAGTFKNPYSFIAPIIAWALYGVYAASTPALAATIIESFPREYVSRWTSFRNVVFRIVAIPCGILGGVLWNIDPRLPFAFALLADIARSLLLIKVPETLIPIPTTKVTAPRHIVVYELPGAGLGTVARLLRNRLGLEIINGSSSEGGIDKVLRSDRPSVIEGEAGLVVAKERSDTFVVLLVAPRHERAIKKMQEESKPLFVVLKEVEEEDKKVSKMVKKYFNADLEHLPPFDIAINTERIPPDVAEEVIELVYREMKKRFKERDDKR
ncbi:MAG: hypothetical protein DRJ51_05640 [Thermoprotei archaeon]|nr:MAG: hypothetical protein DRJ51_05640 [Thermoprotei archaeon]RLF02206.1 MAG: hypothetical protein DRJ59_04210 [Thermoprotei archaeon]